MWRAALVLLLWPACGLADEARSFDDLRAKITELDREVSQLGELLVAKSDVDGVDFPSTPLQRLGEIENELRRLTSNIERLEYRVERIVRDGTMRIADLDRRLCQLEPDCIPRRPASGAPLGGEQQIVPRPAPPSIGPQAMVHRDTRSAFDRARRLFDAGNYADAAAGFLAILSESPTGDLAVSAQYWHGRSVEMLGQLDEAARAYLAAFSRDRDGENAAEALTGLGRVMGQLGQTIEACVIIDEVAERFPASAEVQNARHLRREYDCQ